MMMSPTWVVAAALLLAACAGTEKLEKDVLAAPPAPDAGFLKDPNVMAADPGRAPFDRYWVEPTFEWSHYAKLYVAAVDTRHVLANDFWQKLNLATIDVKKDLAERAVLFHDDMVKAFRDDPKHHFQVLDQPAQVDAKTLVLQAAIVELVPGKAGLGILGTAAWAGPVAVGVPLGTVAAFADQGYVAMEMRVREGVGGEVVVRAADRETGPARVVDIRSMTWYGDTDQVLQQWSQEFVELADTPKDVQVKHSAYFTLSPW